MHKILGAVVLAAMLFLVWPAEACGDKLMSLARGIRLQRAYMAARSASILIYTGTGGGGKALKEAQLQSSLKQAGHKLQMIEDARQLDQALSSGKFDLVLVDFTEAATLSQHMASLPSRPLVLPVLYKPSKAEMAAAEKQFTYAVKAPANSTQHLEAIDEAMKSKARAARS